MMAKDVLTVCVDLVLSLSDSMKACLCNVGF